jgi:hypothetical protein
MKKGTVLDLINWNNTDTFLYRHYVQVFIKPKRFGTFLILSKPKNVARDMLRIV